MFAGKGGVGKTTCAAASAVAAARRGGRILAVSTDPAHSLGDALAVRLGPRPRRVPAGGRGRLEAMELDAPRAFARWLAAHQQALAEALEHGTWLDRDDVEALSALPVPGVDELAGLLEIVALASRASFDRIVVDTAPTGHLLRLIAAPDAVAAVAGVLDALQHEHRVIRAQLARVGRAEAADRFIAELARDAHAAASLLRDPQRTRFHWVLLPEAMAAAETGDALRAFALASLPVASLVINRLTPAGPSCPVCDRRRAAEAAHVKDIVRRFGRGRDVRIVPALAREPRGVRALVAIARTLERSSVDPSAVKLSSARRGFASSGPPSGVPRLAPERIAALADARLLLFGGKGGVGKTTCAAAAAGRLARANPRRRLLLLSTDPAHSLGDVLDAPVSDDARTFPDGPANLDVRELDARAELQRRRPALDAALDEIAGALGGGGIGRSASAGELIDLAPPGIDELLGIVSVAESLAYDTIVVDTAPTGHALRLLEMPGVAREWLDTLMRLLLKYRSVAKPGALAAEVVTLSQSVRRLQALLRDPSATRFVAVTRAAALPVAETTRLLERLRRLRIAVPAVIVNARTLEPGRCPICRASARAERAALPAVIRAVGARRPCVIIQTPLTAPPPHGFAALERWAESWS